MNNLEKLGQKLEPLAIKLASNKYLTAIKDGFIVLMPLLIIGSFAIILNNVILDWGPNSLWYNIGIKIDENTAKELAKYKAIGGYVWQGTLAITSLALSYTVAYSFAKLRGNDGMSAGILSLAAFMTIQTWTVVGQVKGVSQSVSLFAVNPANLGTGNIITAMVVALLSARIYSFFVEKNITIKMPESVPPGVTKAFQSLIPGTVILFGAAIIAFILSTYMETELSKLISDLIAEPLKKYGAEGPLVAYIYVTLANLLYFFGIHGPNTLAFIDATVLTPAAIENANMIAQGKASMNIFSKGMLDSYVFLGGGGATLGLIIAIFLASKREADREISKFSLTPGIFNINEPLVFGLPIVMNPVLFIPFVILPPLLLTTAWIQIETLNSIGLLVNKGAVMIPWVSPVGIGAFLGYQSFSAILIAIVQLAISVIVYLPFVYASNSIKEGNN